MRKGPDDVAARQLRSVLALVAAAQGRNRLRCRSLALAAAVGGPARVMEPVPSTAACAALALAWAGELGAAADAAAQALDAARWTSSGTGAALALLVRSEVAHMRGDLDGALADARQSAALCQTSGATNLGSAAVATVGRILLVRGDLDHLPMEATVPGPEAGGHPYLHALRQETRGMAAAAHGDLSQALRLYLETGRHLVVGGLVNPACSPWRSRAVACLVRLGRTWEARTLADSELDLARRWGSPGPLGRSLVSAAMAYDGGYRMELLDEAIRLLEGTECRLDLARAVIRRGTTLLQDGQEKAARDALERGLDLAKTCSAGTVAQIAKRALAATGARPREQGAAELTVAERRVAELVMRGMSNQAVAATLTLSKRTVDTHLGRIYRKLGIAGRTRLREVLTSTEADQPRAG
jgi:ATP/maltotriose-dependent transcriptional regulator MalT